VSDHSKGDLIFALVREQFQQVFPLTGHIVPLAVGAKKDLHLIRGVDQRDGSLLSALTTGWNRYGGIVLELWVARTGSGLTILLQYFINSLSNIYLNY
jgi:hypothetical protein